MRKVHFFQSFILEIHFFQILFLKYTTFFAYNNTGINLSPEMKKLACLLVAFDLRVDLRSKPHLWS